MSLKQKYVEIYKQKVQEKEQKQKEKDNKIKNQKKSGDRIINGRPYKLVTTVKTKIEARKKQLDFGHWTFVEKTAKGFKIYKLIS